MEFLKTLKKVEVVILGEKKPTDHWKKYRKDHWKKYRTKNKV